MTGERWQSIDTQQWQQQAVYAITISPEAQDNLVKNGELCFPNRVKTIISDMKSVMKKLKYTFLELYVEVSSLGNLHFHGYIAVSNILRFQTEEFLLLKAVGNVVIKTISDDVKWDDYVKKDSVLWIAFLRTLKLYPANGVIITPQMRRIGNYPLICNDDIMAP